MNRDKYRERLNHYLQIAMADYKLECYGRHLVEKHSYPETVSSFEAIYIQLFKTHGWSIDKCRNMSKADLRLALLRDLEAWLPPSDARFEYPQLKD